MSDSQVTLTNFANGEEEKETKGSEEKSEDGCKCNGKGEQKNSQKLDICKKISFFVRVKKETRIYKLLTALVFHERNFDRTNQSRDTFCNILTELILHEKMFSNV